MTLAVGIGCRKGATTEAVIAAVTAAVADLAGGAGAVIATLQDKIGDPAITGAAARLGLPLVFVPRGDMAAVADKAETRSERVIVLFGLPSVAETAALAAAGPGARLIRPRRIVAGVTCAVAEGGVA